jgi:pSer/pThr/pTyr-binding forkhead associated (FHA) protein
MTLRRDNARQLQLVPMHGNHDKKPRILDRDVTTLGRARGCDLRLDAAEISTMHCVIYRSVEVYRVRDCGSRTGTRINGLPAKNTVLHDGDVLQVGPFSFEVRVPPALCPDAPKLDPARVEHWRVSRQRLAAWALELRRRLRQAGSGPAAADVENRTARLRDEIEQRRHQLEAAQRELDAGRQQLAREHEALASRVQRVEADLAARLEHADHEVRQRWIEFQQRCQVEESRLLAQSDGRQERGAEEFQVKVHELTQRGDELARVQKEFQTMKEQWHAEQQQAQADVAHQRSQLAQQEAHLRAQRTEIARMLAELKQAQEDLRRQKQHSDHGGGHDKENRELRERLAALARADEENQRLRQFVAERDQIIDALQRDSVAGPDGSGHEQTVKRLQAENEALRQLLEVQRQTVPQPAPPVLQPQSSGDLEAYETELNQFRQQLEADRAKMEQEWEQLRQRNEELEEATRDMEMQLSRERAEMARERTRIDRMREEVRADTERLQRELAVRENMAPVQRLRDEINQQRRPVKS